MEGLLYLHCLQHCLILLSRHGIKCQLYHSHRRQETPNWAALPGGRRRLCNYCGLFESIHYISRCVLAHSLPLQTFHLSCRITLLLVNIIPCGMQCPKFPDCTHKKRWRSALQYQTWKRPIGSAKSVPIYAFKELFLNPCCLNRAMLSKGSFLLFLCYHYPSVTDMHGYSYPRTERKGSTV